MIWWPDFRRRLLRSLLDEEVVIVLVVVVVLGLGGAGRLVGKALSGSGLGACDG
jgi:hypothetical protein